MHIVSQFLRAPGTTCSKRHTGTSIPLIHLPIIHTHIIIDRMDMVVND